MISRRSLFRWLTSAACLVATRGVHLQRYRYYTFGRNGRIAIPIPRD